MKLNKFRDRVIEWGLLTPEELETLVKGLRNSGIACRAASVARKMRDDEVIDRGFENLLLQDKPALGGYVLQRVIGHGGMGIVFEACSEMDDRIPAALKLLKPGAAADPRNCQRMVNEAVVGNLMRHEHLVRTLSSQVDGDIPFLAIEFVPGGNLRQYVRRNGRLTPEDAVHRLCGIVLALRHVHDQHGYVHRDVKPENVLIADNGSLLLTDFGLAAPIAESLAPEQFTWIGTDGDNPIAGSVGYFPPEQLANEVDRQLDVHSLGWTLYFLVTGNTPPVPTGDLLPAYPPDLDGLPEELKSVILKMTAPRASERYQTMTQVHDTFRDFLGRPVDDATQTISPSAAQHQLSSQLVTEEEFDSVWLQSFDEEQRSVCARLLQIVKTHHFIDEGAFNQSCRSLANEISRRVVHDQDDILFVPQKMSAGSEETLRRLYSSGLMRFPAVTDFLQTNPADIEGRTLVVVDDLSWTGDTAVTVLHEYVGRFGATALTKCSQVIFAFAYARQSAVDRVAQKLQDLNVSGMALAGRILKDAAMLYDAAFSGFSEEEKQQLRDISTQLVQEQFDGRDDGLEEYISIRSCPLVFYYGVHDRLPPILNPPGGQRFRGPFSHLGVQDSQLLPATLHFVNRADELRELADEFSRNRSVLVYGIEGIGKTYFASQFVKYVLAEPDKIQPSVFWHRVRAMGTFQHFVEQLSDYLESQRLSRLGRELRHLPLLTQAVTPFLRKLPEDLIIVIDRADDVETRTPMERILQALLDSSRKDGPRVIVIGSPVSAFALMLESNPDTRKFKLDRFSLQEARRQIDTIWSFAQTHNRELLPLTDDVRTHIYEMGLEGDPIVTSLACSTVLASNGHLNLPEIRVRLNRTRESRPSELLQILWGKLRPAAQLYVAAASALIPPRWGVFVDAVLDRLCSATEISRPTTRTIQEQLMSVGDPFTRIVGRGQSSMLQMTPMLRRLIQQGLQNGQLMISVDDQMLAGATLFRMIHEAASWLFEEHLRDCHLTVSIDDTDRLILAHRHQLLADEYDACANLLLREKRLIFSSSRLNVFASMVGELLSSPHRLSIDDQLSLVFLQLKILRRMARHKQEHRMAVEWLRRVPEEMHEARATLLLHIATTSSAFGKYRECIKACGDSLHILGNLEQEESDATAPPTWLTLRGKTLARMAQTYMTLCDYEEAWKYLRKLFGDVNMMRVQHLKLLKQIDSEDSSQWVDTITHNVAVLCRHISTLLFMQGQAATAMFWITKCNRINKSESKSKSDQEGLAIGEYKQARISWMSDFVAEETLKEAFELTDQAHKRLMPQIHSSIWWQGAMLEQKASLKIDMARLRTSNLTDLEREHLLADARVYLDRTQELLQRVELSDQEVDGLLIRRCELDLLEAKFHAECDDRDQATFLFESLQQCLGDRGIWFLYAIVCYEYGYYLNKWNRVDQMGLPSAAIQQWQMGIEWLIRISTLRAAAPLLRRQYEACSYVVRRGSHNGVAGETAGWTVISAHLLARLAKDNVKGRKPWPRRMESSVQRLLQLPVDSVLTAIQTIRDFFLKANLNGDLEIVAKELLTRIALVNERPGDIATSLAELIRESAATRYDADKRQSKQNQLDRIAMEVQEQTQKKLFAIDSHENCSGQL